MKKYFLNYLRFLTHGEVPDKLLRESFDHKIEDGKLKFKVNMKAESLKDWVWVYGSTNRR